MFSRKLAHRIKHMTKWQVILEYEKIFSYGQILWYNGSRIYLMGKPLVDKTMEDRRKSLLTWDRRMEILEFVKVNAD